MQVTSLGFRTDLALLRLGGTVVEDRGDHLVARSPHNPDYWWGNFLVVAGRPADGDEQLWLDRFASEFPDAGHVTLGFDVTDGTADDLAGFAARGMRTDASSVMTATTVHEPPRPNREATYRQLRTDDDWRQSAQLRAACSDHGTESPTFIQALTATNRALVEAGHGAWFGAFLGDRLVTQMGLVAASPGLARFQAVETHPEVRGRGLAGTLVHHVSRYGFDELGAATLVMVADPGYLAIRIYRAVGFAETETQLQAERPPPGVRP